MKTDMKEYNTTRVEMTPEDKATIERFARKFNVKLLTAKDVAPMVINALLAGMIGGSKSGAFFAQNVLHGNSFSTQDGNGNKETFLNPMAFNGPLDKLGPDQAFFIGMHELGHQALGHSLTRTDTFSHSQIVKRERAAWAWAIKNAGRPPSPNTERYINWSLNTYIQDK
jgi:hypothetical protein